MLMNTRKIQQGVTLFYPPEERSAIHYRQLLRMTSEEIAKEYARGYWTTRMLAEARPKLLSKLLERKRSHRAIHKIIADELEVPSQTVWASLVRIARDFFDLNEEPASFDRAGGRHCQIQ